uniref:A20-type domain-containing protein n=1 Tax=Sinocyclocheilus rhinocerous TaxID=307959 RepID=A0A673H1J9_9TELE
MSAQGVRRGFSVQQSDLMCKRGCGFYGNAVWQGLCSKCWRQENQCTRAKQIEDDRALAPYVISLLKKQSTNAENECYSVITRYNKSSIF